MLYMPKQGHMWDTSVIYNRGQYHMFSMFRYLGGEERYVWSAVSEDGVHFRDVGTVITDELPVWKMFVHKCGDTFAMNYGSLSGRPNHGNDTLRYHFSDDLLHWKECENPSCCHPDPRWYRQEERWDHMYTVEADGKYYGYVVATVKPELGTFGCGMMESDDGIHWNALPPLEIIWGNVEPVNFEVGGCEKIDGKYYLIGGAFRHHGNAGYSVFTFVADTPTGPFRPLEKGYRLCGSSSADHYRGVQWLASFGKNESGDVIITNYMTAQHSPDINFIGTMENVWLTPIKKAVVSGGVLRMAWWKNNEKLKGKRIENPLLEKGIRWENTEYAETGRTIKTCCLTDSIPDAGVMVEGAACVTSDSHFNAARFGFALEAPEGFRTVTVQAGKPEYTHGEIVDYQTIGQLPGYLADIVEPHTAGKTNVIPGEVSTFRLLVRKDMFELYVDDLLVQTYLCLDNTMAVHLYSENANVKIDRMDMFEMTL